MSQAEYREQSQRLRRYADQVGLAIYLYVLTIQPDGKAAYLMDSPTAQQSGQRVTLVTIWKPIPTPA